MKNSKLMSIVEDILNEGKDVWEAPNEWAEYKDKNHASSELKKFPTEVRKHFEVKKAVGKEYAIVAKSSFKKTAEKAFTRPESKTEWALGSWDVGIDDTNNPHYINKA